MSLSSITFYGGVGKATGSNFLLHTSAGDRELRMLVDCGLSQGSLYAEDENYQPFAYAPGSVDLVFITHAHIDHIGRLPKLVREGFKGIIYSTEATRLIAEAMFEDALKIMMRESHERGRDPLYDNTDVAKTLSLWKTLEYGQKLNLGTVAVEFKDAGHILGSAYVEFSKNGKKVVFSGDLGNTPSPLVKDTALLQGATFLVTESVYGDRNHEDIKLRRSKLREAIVEVIRKQGVLLIPAFSLERTQVILYEINNMVEDNEIPSVPVFLDSPLAIKVTSIYAKMKHLFNASVQREISSGDDIFRFPKLTLTAESHQSDRIYKEPNPKIIIAGGGMSEGGRVMSHEKKYLADARNTILLIGYQAAGTFGRQLAEGAKKVRIQGETIEVRAEISMISGYSSHKDSNGIIEFIASSADTLKKVYVVLGEPKASLFLAQRIKDELGIEAIYPELGTSYSIDF